jgi:hypothetical protein
MFGTLAEPPPVPATAPANGKTMANQRQRLEAHSIGIQNTSSFQKQKALRNQVFIGCRFICHIERPNFLYTLRFSGRGLDLLEFEDLSLLEGWSWGPRGGGVTLSQKEQQATTTWGRAFDTEVMIHQSPAKFVARKSSLRASIQMDLKWKHSGFVMNVWDGSTK